MKKSLLNRLCLGGLACASFFPILGYGNEGLLNVLPHTMQKTNNLPLISKEKQMEAVQRKNDAYTTKKQKCKIDTSLAIAKFEEDPRNPIAGKNVLIIGASKGNGNGAAQAFFNAGANVIGTSRAPQDYTGQPWLSPVPIDITLDSSVENFFKTEPTLKKWDHIDILVLGGDTDSLGTLFQSKASDFFPKINCELLGRHRVVERAIKWMQHVDDSRMITLSSISSFVPLPEVSSYSLTKAALDGWVKQWNTEREWFKQLTGEYVCKTLAMSVQPSFVNTSIGSLPPSLCNPVAPLPFNNYPSGLKNPYSQSMFAGQLGVYGNSLVQNLTKEEVGMAILYMATVVNPEWLYVVEKEGGEQICFNGRPTDLTCLLRKMGQHKVRDVLTEWVSGYNWNAAFENILNEGNTKGYSVYICPPKNQKAPLTAVPPLPKGYPNCTNGEIRGIPPNIILEESVSDLFNNPCKPNDPCPPQ